MSDRITQLDTVRGVAVLGILIMNSVSFALGNVAYFDITEPADSSALDQAVGMLGEVFADQKFMALFSMLFGASVLLFLERVAERTSHPVRLSLWRNALLFGIGLLHASAWEGDVLLVYALCAPVMLLLRRASATLLGVLGIGIFSLSLPSAWVLGDVDDAAIRTMWTGVIDTPQTGRAGLLFVADVFSRAIGMMLLGMSLYKRGFLQRPLPARAIAWSATAIALGSICSGLGVAWVLAQGSTAGAIARGNVLNGLATVPMALGYLVLLMAWDQQRSGRWLHRTRCLGRMALTNYLGQTVLCLCLVATVPAAWLTRTTVWLGIVAVWLVQLHASEAWLRSFRMGPLEWLWRCATYRSWTPLRR